MFRSGLRRRAKKAGSYHPAFLLPKIVIGKNFLLSIRVSTDIRKKEHSFGKSQKCN